MGWIDPEEQKRVREKFGVTADHMCDDCGKPIVGLVFIDSKGGYFPKPAGLPDFLPRKPKRTHCQECDDARTGKTRPPKPIGHTTVHGDGSVSVKVKPGTKDKVQENLKKDFATGKKTGHGTVPSGPKSSKRLAAKILELLDADRKKKWKVPDLRELLSSAHSSKQIREALNLLWAGNYLSRENGGLRHRKGKNIV